MIKYKKREMLKIVSTLEKANDAVYRNNNGTNREQVEDALAQCQELAILLGSYIEVLETSVDGALHLVEILEEYCEDIYQMSVGITDDNLCEKLSIKIRKQLCELKSRIEYDLPDDKLEVVFLPYKASMWDSLESVWKAADADQHCQAYVIPIPYYDKDSDGTFGGMHYEGNQYPDYVPVTNYEQYDFADRRPDIIFIHNPYDNNNYVTSVDPLFYSENLKQFTECLVYIPYFILEEIDPENKNAVESIQGFCMSPGVINADKTIVQSEAMRQAYIKLLTEACGNTADSRQYWEDKILALGSPKVDKVQNTLREDMEIPEEWMKIISKPDGTWKKIIFYNTSVTSFLENNGKMLKKIEDVFSVFQEKKDEVALLWRPHPLIESTVKAMRPQLWEEYRTIREQYIYDGWGIYDDTADMDRAVALSDAYYGDASSVVQLCEAVGKPVMIQNVDILNGDIRNA